MDEYLGFPAPVLYPSTTVGGWQETEWAPIRGSATRTGLNSISQKTKKLQIRQNSLKFTLYPWLQRLR